MLYAILCVVCFILTVIFLIVNVIAGSDADSPLMGWGIFVLLSIATWYFYKKVQVLADEKRMKEQTMTDERFTRIPNFKPTQRYTSPNGDLTLAIDERSKQIAFININFYHKDKVYKYRDILKSEILTDGISVISTNRGSQIGGAILGGLLTGGVGAIIGGLSGSKTSQEKIKKIELNVIVNDTASPVLKIAFLDSQISSYSKDSQEYKSAYDRAYHWHQLIAVLIRQADEEDRASEQTNQNKDETVQVLSVADELRKLKQLKEEGILTDEEFDTQKKRLIGG